VRRLQNAGLAVLLLAVVGLIASSVMGIGGKPVPAAAARTAAGPVAEPPPDRVTVEVLNASGRPGLARSVMLYLRDRGFDVVRTGNAQPADGTATRVIDRVRNPRRAREVADSLGIAAVATLPDPSLMLDASVVLGRDWRMPGGAAESAAVPVDSAAVADSGANASHLRPAPAASAQPKPAAPRPIISARPKAPTPAHPRTAAPKRLVHGAPAAKAPPKR
jgi:hypothetical protein